MLCENRVARPAAVNLCELNSCREIKRRGKHARKKIHQTETVSLFLLWGLPTGKWKAYKLRIGKGKHSQKANTYWISPCGRQARPTDRSFFMSLVRAQTPRNTPLIF
jgi:hypothetical protein